VLEVIRIFSTVAKALAYMNSKGFIHADIKPNNILVDDRGRIKIIDLGQSCRLGTIKERIQGTPDFISPEQVHRRPLDARTDVFNFGASLYWTLVARPIPTVLPPREDQIGKVRDAALKDMTLVAPCELNHNIPPSLNKLVLDCVEIHPKNRPVSMDEVASRLELISHSIKRDQPNQKTEG
jgi:serine/threonine-protein kinase